MTLVAEECRGLSNAMRLWPRRVAAASGSRAGSSRRQKCESDRILASEGRRTDTRAVPRDRADRPLRVSAVSPGQVAIDLARIRGTRPPGHVQRPPVG
jgi:hypothetical protein